MEATTAYVRVEPDSGGTCDASTIAMYWPNYASAGDVERLEAENSKLQRRMKRLEKLVAAALIRIDEED